MQHTVVVIELKDRNMTGGDVFWFFGAFLTAVTLADLKSPVPLFLIILLLNIVLWLIVGLDMD